MALIVNELTTEDDQAWDEFVRASPHGLPHHRLGWREVIGRTYGYRPRYLVARSDAKVVGVMPLFEVPSRIEGFHLTTLPGGLCAASDEAGYALVQRAKELVRSSNARFLAIRDSRRKWDDELVSHHSQCSVVIDVSDGLAAFQNSLSRSVRQHIAQGKKSGVELTHGTEDLGSFYQVFAAFLQSRGTPIFPERFLATQVEVFQDEVRLRAALHQGKLVAGSVSFLLGSALFSISLFSLDDRHKLKINHLLYWDRIQLACERGLELVDLGRSSIGSGQYDFKMSWRGFEVPIYQQFWLHRTRKMPLLVDDARRGYGRLFARVWQRLPVQVAHVVGPLIRRELPFV